MHRPPNLQFRCPSSRARRRNTKDGAIFGLPVPLPSSPQGDRTSMTTVSARDPPKASRTSATAKKVPGSEYKCSRVAPAVVAPCAERESTWPSPKFRTIPTRSVPAASYLNVTVSTPATATSRSAVRVIDRGCPKSVLVEEQPPVAERRRTQRRRKRGVSPLLPSIILDLFQEVTVPFACSSPGSDSPGLGAPPSYGPGSMPNLRA